MHLIKPTWLAHGGDLRDFEVYSCHVSPDSKRLATAGGDGYIRIWSTEAILKSGDPNFTGPRQLAAVSNHTGTIHTVRFSPNNKYLASGADDKIVCIYSIEPGKSVGKVFGSSEDAPVENWRVTRRLIGHENDVQDLGWSCDSSILVSVGLDSKVVIWSGYTFEKLKTLAHHQSHVKGITFDPANKYFATASDDRTVRIYRFTPPGPNSTAQDQAGNFVHEQTVRDPFDGSPLTTYFRRCSWSPDGNHIAAANAVNGPVRSVAIINRGSWESEINLIGHEGPVEVCAFSPRLFYREPLPENDNGDHSKMALTVIACAGQDKTLSVWNTSHSRPFVILQDASRKSVSDLAWAPDGETLFVSSLDGAIFAAVFETGELGYVAPEAEREKTLERYGGGRKARVLESVDGLMLEAMSREAEAKDVDERLGMLMGAGTVATGSGPGEKADGKNGTGENSRPGNTDHAIGAPTTNGNANSASVNGVTTTTIASNQAVSNTAASADAPANPLPSPVPPPPNPVEELKQRVTYTKEGRKKIRPVLISGTAEQMSTLPTSQTVTQTAVSEKSETGHAPVDLSKPFDILPPGGIAGLIFGTRRKFAEGQERTERKAAAVSREGGVPILMDGPSGLVAPEGPTPTSIGGVSLPAPIISPAVMVSRLRLGTPTLRPLIQRTADCSAPEERSPVPTISIQNTPRSATRIVCSSGSRVLWTDFLPRPILLATGNEEFWAVGCDDCSLVVWSPAGRRLFAPLILDASTVLLDCKGSYLVAITAVGMMYVWDVRLMKALHPPVSLAPILDSVVQQESTMTTTPSILFARLTLAGTVVVALSNGTAYTYTERMAVWQRVSEPWWAVSSQYWNTSSRITPANPNAPNHGPSLGSGVIPFLERHTTTFALVRGRAFFLQRLVKSLLATDGFDGLETAASVGHLETRLASALAIGAKDEFRAYLLTYAKRIGAERMGDRVTEVLDSLVYLEDEDEDPEVQNFREKDRTTTTTTATTAAIDGSSTAPGSASLAQLSLNGDHSLTPDPAQVERKLKSKRRQEEQRREESLTMQDRLSSAWFGDGPRLCGWNRMELLADVIKVLGKYRDLHRVVLPYARLVGVVGRNGGGAGLDGLNGFAAGGGDRMEE